jgi:transcriptional regulator with XRE-family HTH domain
MSLTNTIYSDDYRYLIDRLRQARAEAGLTQSQVARHFGVGQSFISKIESGQYRIDVIQLKLFAQLYGKPFKVFLKSE